MFDEVGVADSLAGDVGVDGHGAVALVDDRQARIVDVRAVEVIFHAPGSRDEPGADVGAAALKRVAQEVLVRGADGRGVPPTGGTPRSPSTGSLSLDIELPPWIVMIVVPDPSVTVTSPTGADASQIASMSVNDVAPEAAFVPVSVIVSVVPAPSFSTVMSIVSLALVDVTSSVVDELG